MRPVQEAGSVLVIQRLGYNGNPIDRPYQIEKCENFASRLFD
jgi:hypothetical protein